MGICFKKNSRIMEELLEKIETLIDDMERDSQLTREETLSSLREIKDKAEDIHLSLEY
jgi:hypothetical protein